MSELVFVIIGPCCIALKQCLTSELLLTKIIIHYLASMLLSFNPGLGYWQRKLSTAARYYSLNSMPCHIFFRSSFLVCKLEYLFGKSLQGFAKLLVKVVSPKKVIDVGVLLGSRVRLVMKVLL